MFEEENHALKATVDAYSKKIEASRRVADQKEKELMELKTSGF